MGYCYVKTATGRYALACDGCGAGGARKRPCPHTVTSTVGGWRCTLPYCAPPALCAACWEKRGRNAIHATCKVGAAAQQAREDAKTARLAAGGLYLRTCWTEDHSLPAGWPQIPADKLVASFESADGREALRVMPRLEYDCAHKQWLDDYPEAGNWP